MAYSHIIGFDDTPFDRSYRGPVRVMGAVYAPAAQPGAKVKQNEAGS